MKDLHVIVDMILIVLLTIINGIIIALSVTVYNAHSPMFIGFIFSFIAILICQYATCVDLNYHQQMIKNNHGTKGEL